MLYVSVMVGLKMSVTFMRSTGSVRMQVFFNLFTKHQYLVEGYIYFFK